ncbi:phosphonate C-P lyase system protein PhnH [Halomontanus rarus]|uniref:phosphonate C-P lyase system protein PhnH n=1 Tax=Halomontanus rarus TaxID=3034020 RepID=UPI0023E82A31|nr:phosphonate C-P lyase system protein PhnH [Halovivax sp. TS33]
MRALGLDPVHDTRETFRALCDATSRPATVRRLPVAPGDHAVAATLVDHEVTTHTPDDDLREALAAQGRYEAAEPTDADIVHARGVPPWDVRDLERGSLVEPSEGATVLYRVESLESDPEDEDGLSTVTVSGPGVPETRTVGIGLPAAELEAIADAQSTAPRGVDAIFTAGDRVVAIPRSASMSVEAETEAEVEVV